MLLIYLRQNIYDVVGAFRIFKTTYTYYIPALVSYFNVCTSRTEWMKCIMYTETGGCNVYLGRDVAKALYCVCGMCSPVVFTFGFKIERIAFPAIYGRQQTVRFIFYISYIERERYANILRYCCVEDGWLIGRLVDGTWTKMRNNNNSKDNNADPHVLVVVVVMQSVNNDRRN